MVGRGMGVVGKRAGLFVECICLPSTRLRRLWRGPRPPLVKLLSRTRALLQTSAARGGGGRHEWKSGLEGPCVAGTQELGRAYLEL